MPGTVPAMIKHHSLVLRESLVREECDPRWAVQWRRLAAGGWRRDSRCKCLELFWLHSWLVQDAGVLKSDTDEPSNSILENSQ